MKQQLFFDLQKAESYGDFLPSACNEHALKAVDLWPHWPSAGLVLYGPPSSGKTHLLYRWCNTAQAQILEKEQLTPENILALQETEHTAFAIDNIDTLVQDTDRAQALFHLYNMTTARNGHLMFTATADIAGWNCPLPDLMSRLKTLSGVSLAPPDHMLLETLLVKFFSDRQTKISPDVISYVLKRIQRNGTTAYNFAAALDAAALAQKRPISIPLAREILQKHEK